MSDADIPVQDLLNFLSQSPDGKTLAQFQARFGATDAVSRVVTEAVMTRQMSLRFDAKVPLNGLRFVREIQSDEFVDPRGPRSAAINAVVRHVHQRYDNRGDPMETSSLSAMQEDLAKTLGADAVTQAVHDAMREGLLTIRVVAPNQHIYFSISGKTHFTVMATDHNVNQPLCFHVRAGNKEVALAKVRASVYGGEETSIHGICPGIVHFAVAETSGYLVEVL
jgi:hypothetical protein